MGTGTTGPKHLDGRVLGRRQVARVALVGLAAGAAGTSGCASVLGEEEVDAYFRLEPDSEGNFFGWSEITINGADPQEDDAILLQALLKAEGSGDLTFIQSIVAEAVLPEARTPLAEGSNFPEGESIAPLDLLHEGGIGQFFQPAEEEGDNKIRIEWTGKANPDHVFPDGGYRVNVIIKVEVQ